MIDLLDRFENKSIPVPDVSQVQGDLAPGARIHPDDGVALQLYVAIGNRQLPLSRTRHYGTFTHNPVHVYFQPEDHGKIVTYFSRWVSDDGDSSPWSPPTTHRIVA